jgi:hypothetical protein
VDATLQFSAVWWPKNGDPAFRRFLSVARTLAKQTRQLSNHGMARHSPQSGAAGTISGPRRRSGMLRGQSLFVQVSDMPLVSAAGDRVEETCA